MKKCAILAAVLLVSVGILQYAFLFGFHNEGAVFNSMGEDEALFIALIKSAKLGYESPWTLESDGVNRLAFLNPANGPVFMLIPLSYLHLLSGWDARMIFIAFKVFSAAFLLAALYFFVRAFEKNASKPYVLLILSAGFGGILHLFISILYPERLFYPQSLFGFGVSIFRFVESYQAFSLALGAVSLVFYMRERRVLSGVFVGLSLMFYPVHGISFLMIFIIHRMIFRKPSDIIKVFAVSALFASVWVVSYLIQPLLFHNYSKTVGSVSVNVLPSVLLGLGPLFIILLADMRKKFGISKNMAVFAVAAFLLMSYYQISISVWAPQLPVLPEPLFILMNAPFLMLALYFLKETAGSGMDKKTKFMYAWFFVFLFIVMFPVKLFSLLPPKATVFLYAPLTLIAYERMKSYRAWVMPAIVIISLVSIFFFYSFEQMDARNIYGQGMLREQSFFFSDSDVKALEFLKSMPPGNVMSSGEIGTYVPYYAEKKSLLFGTNRGDIVLDVEQKLGDYRKFFYSPSKEILDRYGIKYVFYGEFERREGSIGDQPYMKKIYSDGTEIYEVIQ